MLLVLNRSDVERTRFIRARFFTPFIVTAASAFAVQAAAQTKVEPVVLTASRTAESLADTIRDVSVLRGEDLIASGANDIVTALQGVSALEVQTLGAGATPSIFVRGGNSNQVLILIDGQRIGSSFSGQSALQHIPISQIDRIEIVRGPAASLYGADAVSGVIQVFTKKSAGLSAGGALGEQRSSDLSARAGFASGGNSLSVSANHRESRGFNAIVNPKDFSFNPDRDGYRFSSAQLNGSAAVTPAFTVDANVFAARGNVQYDSGADTDDRIKSSVQNVSAKARYSPSARWTSTLSLGQSVDKSEFISAFPGNYKTVQGQLSWQNTFQWQRDTTLWNAIESRHERATSSDDFAVTSRRTTSAAFGADATFNALKVAASFRVDDSNQYATRATGNVGISYALGKDWSVLLNAGTSFKAPSFNDLYFPGFSNPNLAPEKAKNVDAALRWSNEASNAKLVVYENRVRDLIQFQCDADFNCAPQNVAQARLRGATVSAGTRVAGWLFDASVDIADPINTKTDKRLARRTNVHGALKASGDVMGFASGIELVASGNRFDDAANTRRLAGYGAVNVFARKEIARGMSVGVRIDNAFDRDYQHSFGYTNGGRRGWITFNVNQL
jgi:vitamin B12 transporter